MLILPRPKGRFVSTQSIKLLVDQIAPTNKATLRTVHIFLLPFCDTTANGTGSHKMYALNSKVMMLIFVALATTIVVHSSVYLSIDAASLSAEMPAR